MTSSILMLNTAAAAAEQFNEFLEVLFKGPAGPIIGFGLLIVVFLICAALEKK